MDDGKGTFVEIPANFLSHDLEKLYGEHPDHGGTFREGEIVELKGSRFEVTKIIQNGLKLRLLPKDEGELP